MSSEAWRPSPSRLAKDAVKRMLALPWEAGFACLRLASRRRPERWRPCGGPVLVVAPHPDDEVHGVGGTILLHGAAGDPVTVVHVTDGRQSRALGLGPDEMAQRRRTEAERAGELLGLAGFRWLGFPEGAWEEEPVVASLRRHVVETRARVIYAPSRVDFHPEHHRVATALARALDESVDAGPPCVRVYPVQVPLTSILVGRVAATGEVAGTSRAALERYETQLGALRASLRMKRYAALRFGAGHQAETFWEMSAAKYRALHRGPTAGGAFRGIRPMPFSDPLAYLVGRGERRRLREAAPLE